MILVASAYFLNDFPKFIANFKRFIPLRYRAVYEDVGQKADIAVGGYLRGQLLIALVLGIFLYIGLLLIGIKLPLAISFLAAVLNLVPYLGSIVGAIPAILLGLTTQTPFTSALLVIILFIVANQLEGNLLSPFILSRSTNLHPVTVLIAITFGLGTFGLVGALFLPCRPWRSPSWCSRPTCLNAPPIPALGRVCRFIRCKTRTLSKARRSVPKTHPEETSQEISQQTAKSPDQHAG